MQRWYNLSKEDKVAGYQQVAEAKGLPAYAVEKDWWVVQTLTILFETEIADYTVFKGGTSLSKAWKLIERFSEDIDLAVDRSFYGFEGPLSKNKRDKLKKKAKGYIIDQLFPILKESFISKGLIGVKLEPDDTGDSDQDPVVINVYYPNVIEPTEYVKPIVKIELGCRSLREPFSQMHFSSLIDMQFPDTPFALQPIQIPTVDPERTLLEKLFLLHEEFQRPPEKTRVDRMSRHLYDIYKLSQSEFAEKIFSNQELYTEIVLHRKSYTKVSGVDYNLHNPATLNPIPPANLIDAWKKDYATMQEQMIYGQSADFDPMIAHIKSFVTQINQLDWKIFE